MFRIKSKINSNIKFPKNIDSLLGLYYNSPLSFNNFPENLDYKGTSSLQYNNSSYNLNNNPLENIDYNNTPKRETKVKYKDKNSRTIRTKKSYISCAARDNISNLALALEKEFTPQKLTFWTHIIPPNIFNKIQKKFGEYVSRLIYYLKRYCVSKGLQNFHYLRVLEFHKDGRPHLHILFYARKKNKWLVTPKEIDKIVLKVLRSFKINVTANDIRATNQLKAPKKSLATYLSKSSSKKSTTDWIPSSWYSADRGTHRIVEKYTKIFYTNFKDIYEFCAYLKSLGLNPRFVEKRVGDQTVIVGGWCSIPSYFKEKFFRLLASRSIYIESQHSCPLPYYQLE